MKLLFAYLDPATGSLIVSAIVGGFAAIALFFKNYWFKIKSLIGLGGSDETSAAAPRTDEAFTE
jgi:hypothetical protein